MNFFHTTITDVRYSRQLADSYSPVLPDKWIDPVSVHSLLWKSSADAHDVHSLPFPFFFKRSALLMDTNI